MPRSSGQASRAVAGQAPEPLLRGSGVFTLHYFSSSVRTGHWPTPSSAPRLSAGRDRCRVFGWRGQGQVGQEPLLRPLGAAAVSAAAPLPPAPRVVTVHPTQALRPGWAGCLVCEGAPTAQGQGHCVGCGACWSRNAPVPAGAGETVVGVGSAHLRCSLWRCNFRSQKMSVSSFSSLTFSYLASACPTQSSGPVPASVTRGCAQTTGRPVPLPGSCSGQARQPAAPGPAPSGCRLRSVLCRGDGLQPGRGPLPCRWEARRLCDALSLCLS